MTIVHSLMADAAGNAVMSPPFYEDAWAAFAARRRVIVTTEKGRHGDVVRRYAQFVRVPAARVSWVCEVPFGSHPNQVPGKLCPRSAATTTTTSSWPSCALPRETRGSWTRGSGDGSSGCAATEECLAQLGARPAAELRAKTDPEGWQRELPVLATRWADPPSRGERNAVLGARYLRQLVQRDGLRVGLAGVGISTLAAWLAADLLRQDGIAFDLLAEGGMYGFTPLPLDPYLFNYRNLFTSSWLSNVQTILDVVAGGYANQAVGVLGAAQVDSRGAINTSRIKGRMLTGSGGGNDIASTASAVVVTTVHDRARLPEDR